MKETIKKTTIKYDEQGRIIEQIETTTEKEYFDGDYPSIPFYPISPVSPLTTTPIVYCSTTDATVIDTK